MNTVIQEAIKKIFATEPEKATEWIDKIDDVNRTIQEAEMVARETTPVVTVVERADPPPAETPPPAEGETPPPADAAGTAVPATIEIDDALLQKIAEKVVAIMEEKKMAAPTEAAASEEVAKQVDAKMSTTNETLRTVESNLNDLAGKLTAVMQDVLQIATEVEEMHRNEEDKKRAWLDDMTSQVVPMRITYRPREKGKSQETDQPAQLPTMADIANETLAALNAKEKLVK